MLDDNDKIIKTFYGGENCWITFGGQAFFTKSLSEKLISYIEPVYDNPEFKNKYWVDFQDEHLKELPMYIKRIEKNGIVEFNSLAALREFDSEFSALSVSKTMKFLCEELSSKEQDLKEFEPIKEGNYAIGCKFKYNQKYYKYLCNNQSLHECTSN